MESVKRLLKRWKRWSVYLFGTVFISIIIILLPIEKNSNYVILIQICIFIINNVYYQYVLKTIANFFDPNIYVSMNINHLRCDKNSPYWSYVIGVTNLTNKKITITEIGVAYYTKKNLSRPKYLYCLEWDKHFIDSDDIYKNKPESIDFIENAVGHFEEKIGIKFSNEIWILPYAIDIHNRKYFANGSKAIKIDPIKLSNDIEEKYQSA